MARETRRTDIDIERVGRHTAAAFRRISWGALFAGLVVALAIQLLLSLLGIAIGMASIEPVTEENPMQNFGIATGIYWLISTAIAVFAGGWTAGRLAGMPTPLDSILHGAVTWALFALFTIWLSTSAVGGILTGVGNMLGSILQTAGQGISKVMQSGTGQQGGQMNWNQIESEINQFLTQQKNPQDTQVSAQQASREIQQIARKVFSGQQGNRQVNTQELVDVLAQRTEMSRQEAQRVVDQWGQQVAQMDTQELEQKAERTAKDVKSAIGSAAIWMFVWLLITLVAGAVGGKVGEPHDLEGGLVPHDTELHRDKD